MRPYGLNDTQAADFDAWRERADRADRERGEAFPADQLPGWLHCRAAITELYHLTADYTPAALTRTRQLLRSALSVVPQPGPAQYCHYERWQYGRPVCDTLTCGRCAPIRAAEPGVHWTRPRRGSTYAPLLGPATDG